MFSVALVLFCCLRLCASDDKVGDMKPLGNQRASEGHIEILTSIPSVEDFFKKYITPGKPVVFKEAAKDIPAFKLWTDEYLRTTFGSVKAFTEDGKKENRSEGSRYFSMEDFIDTYKTKDMYMVHSIPQNMRDDISLLPCISCGGYLNVMMDVVLWFSSGGTKSVFHNDGVDNINCLFSGTKELYMVDKKYEEEAHLDVVDGGYSSVDVDAVNLTKYPNFAKIPWYEARMEQGDCLFIPYRWLHQVRSHGRNIAVNVWFGHLRNIDQKDCKTNTNTGKFIPMTNVTLKPLDGFRNILLMELNLKKNKQFKKRDILTIIEDMGGDSRPALIKKVWKLLDKNNDRVVTKEELMQLQRDELEYLNRCTPMYTQEDDDPRQRDSDGEDMNEEEDDVMAPNRESSERSRDNDGSEADAENADDRELDEWGEKNDGDADKGEDNIKDEL